MGLEQFEDDSALGGDPVAVEKIKDAAHRGMEAGSRYMWLAHGMIAEDISANHVQRPMGNVAAISSQAHVAVCELTGLGVIMFGPRRIHVPTHKAPVSLATSIEHCS